MKRLIVFGLIPILFYFNVSASGYGKVPHFILTAQNGKRFSSANLKGRVWVADFIYTRCSDECPMLSEKMKRLQAQFPGKLYLVSFSVDPAHDNPAVLARYAKRYSAGPDWYFLTGNPKSISRLMKNGFHLPSGKQGSAILHSNRIVLIDSSGMIRGYYDSDNQAELYRLAKDIRIEGK